MPTLGTSLQQLDALLRIAHWIVTTGRIGGISTRLPAAASPRRRATPPPRLTAAASHPRAPAPPRPPPAAAPRLRVLWWGARNFPLSAPGLATPTGGVAPPRGAPARRWGCPRLAATSANLAGKVVNFLAVTNTASHRRR